MELYGRYYFLALLALVMFQFRDSHHLSVACMFAVLVKCHRYFLTFLTIEDLCSVLGKRLKFLWR